MENFNSFNNPEPEAEKQEYNKYRNMRQRIELYMDEVEDERLLRQMQETVKELEELEKQEDKSPEQ